MLIVVLLYFCLLPTRTLNTSIVNDNVYLLQSYSNYKNIRLEKTIEKNNQINKKTPKIKTDTNTNDFGVHPSHLDVFTPAIVEDLYFTGRNIGVKHGEWIKKKISKQVEVN